MKKIVLAVLLVVLAIGVIAGPALAELIWEHRWDTYGVTIDVPGRMLHVYGQTHWAGLGDATQVFGRTLSCPLSYGERVFVWSRPDGQVKVFGGCARMTPTPAPTQEP
jgi:hypothetical protein